jgi:hypothetical protein
MICTVSNYLKIEYSRECNDGIIVHKAVLENSVQ